MPYVITRLDSDNDLVSVIGVFDDNHEDDAHSRYTDFRLASTDPAEDFFFEEVDSMNKIKGTLTNRCRVYLGYDNDEIHISAIKEDRDVEVGTDDDDLEEIMDFYEDDDEDIADLRNRALQTVSSLLWDNSNMDEEDLDELINSIHGVFIPDDAIKIDYREFETLEV